MYFPMDRTADITTGDGPVVNHWLEWKLAQIYRLDRMIPTFTGECSLSYVPSLV